MEKAFVTCVRDRRCVPDASFSMLLIERDISSRQAVELAEQWGQMVLALANNRVDRVYMEY